jgi:hypothetical protein
MPLLSSPPLHAGGIAGSPARIPRTLLTPRYVFYPMPRSNDTLHHEHGLWNGAPVAVRACCALLLRLIGPRHPYYYYLRTCFFWFVLTACP